MFRFAICDVLWLTVVVALAAGWWIDHRSQGAWREGIAFDVLTNFIEDDGYDVHRTPTELIIECPDGRPNQHLSLGRYQ